MEIKSVDSIEALNLVGADIDVLRAANEKIYVRFDYNDARHRSRVVTDVADAGFYWGSPLVEFLPEGHDEVSPSKKHISQAVKAFRDAARKEDPYALYLLGEWSYRRATVARFIDSVYDIAWAFLKKAAMSYKQDLIAAALARELLARLIEDGHYYFRDNEECANRLRNSAAKLREVYRRKKMN